VYFYPGSQYLCLLSQYEAGMRFVLEDLGIQDLKVQAPELGSLLGILGISGARALWSGLLAIDLLIKAACEKRPYERIQGETDRIHAENLDDIERGLAENALKNSLDRCIKRLETIEVDPEQRPLIGIAGDVYTRSNPVANKRLFQRLEELGCEVWPAPFLVDHIGFSMHRALYRKISQGKFRDSAQLGLLSLYREIESRKVLKKLKKISTRFAEPGYRETLSLTSSYIGQNNNEILLCNVAKMADFAKRGADGVINAICLNCMLGTASTAIAMRIRKDFSHIPIPTMVFNGTDDSAEQSLLEAFVYQVKNYAASKRGSAGKGSA
jgi:predicted nucleotide-binding protein (sugar kinase/HSP70/actin superfamily)